MNNLLLVCYLFLPLLLTDPGALGQEATVERSISNSNNPECRLLNFFPFTFRAKEQLREPYRSILNTTVFHTDIQVDKLGYDYTATTLLAMQDFNNRDFDMPAWMMMMDEKNPDDNTCSFRFDIQNSVFADSGHDDAYAFANMLRFAPRDVLEQPRSPSSSSSGFCAMQGPYFERAIDKTGQLAGTFSIPLLHYHTGEYRHALMLSGPDVVLNWATHNQLAFDIVSFLQDRRDVLHPSPDHLAVVHFNKNFMSRLTDQIEQAAVGKVSVRAFETVMAPPPFDRQQFYLETMRSVKRSGYTTIFLAYDRAEHLVDLAEALEANDMLNGQYLYLLTTDASPPHEVAFTFGSVSPDTALGKLLLGSVVLAPLDGYTVDPQNDRLLQKWQSQNTEFVDLVNAKVPGFNSTSSSSDGFENWQANHNYFTTSEPYTGASFVYDSVMAIGLGGCLQEKRERLGIPTGPIGNFVEDPNLAAGLPSFRPDNRFRDKLRPLTGAISDIETTTGASGTIKFTSDHKLRTRDTFWTGAYNIQYQHGTWEVVLASVRHLNLTWTEQASYVYNSGSELPPTVKLYIKEENYLSPWVRKLGLFLWSLALALGMGFILVIYVLRKKERIMAAQPFFLVLLCVGSMTLSSSIFSLSFDERAGWSMDSLSTACIITPWLFFLGQVTVYAALFCKMWRVNQLLQMRRRVITVARSIWPLAVLLVITIGLLLTWTIYDPWTWNRMLVSDDPPETYGECSSDNVQSFFIPLAVVTVIATSLAVVLAYKTIDVTDILSDTKPTFYAVATHLQAWFIGLPVLSALGDDSADATYLARVLVVWIFGVSTPVIVILPKLFEQWRDDSGNESPGSRVRISGLDGNKSGSTSLSQQFCSKCNSQSVIAEKNSHENAVDIREAARQNEAEDE